MNTTIKQLIDQLQIQKKKVIVAGDGPTQVRLFYEAYNVNSDNRYMLRSIESIRGLERVIIFLFPGHPITEKAMAEKRSRGVLFIDAELP